MTVKYAHAGGNYVVRERGNFTLRDGKVTAVTGRPVLVVSDLDDTMVRLNRICITVNARCKQNGAPCDLEMCKR